MEKYSFVDVEKETADLIMETLNGTYYKKRKVTFEVASGKKKENAKKEKTLPKKKKRKR